MTLNKRQWLLNSLALVVLAIMISTRFIDPSMTETELFLRYWWLYTSGGAAILVLMTAAARMDKS